MIGGLASAKRRGVGRQGLLRRRTLRDEKKGQASSRQIRILIPNHFTPQFGVGEHEAFAQNGKWYWLRLAWLLRPAAMSQTPLPEWAQHQAVWIGFPSAADLWEGDLAPAQAEVAAFAAAVHANGAGEQVWLVAADEMAAAEARRLAPFAKVIVEPFGDIWLRDTGAIVIGSGDQRRAQGFGFNGWGGKYDLAGDDSIGERLAAAASLPYAKADWILEGGAIDGDGTGTFLTTGQCLLNPNRNPGLSRDEVEQRL